MDRVPDAIVEQARRRFLLVDVRNLTHGARALILSLPSEREELDDIVVYGRLAYVWAKPNWASAATWVVTFHQKQSTVDRDFHSLKDAFDWTDRYLHRDQGLPA